MDEETGPDSRTKGFRHVAGGMVLILAVLLLFGVAVELLWNWLMPDLFGLRTISYLQSIGLLLLSRILLGRIGQRRDHAGYLTGKYGFRSLFGKKRENSRHDV